MGNSFSARLRNNVKSEAPNALVNVTVENLKEIRPLQSIAQKWRFCSKMGIGGSGDLENQVLALKNNYRRLSVRRPTTNTAYKV